MAIEPEDISSADVPVDEQIPVPEPTPAESHQDEAQPRPASTTVTAEGMVTQPADPKDLRRAIAMLRLGLEEFNEAIAGWPNTDPVTDKESKEWFSKVQQGTEMILTGGVHLGALAREGSDWRQTIEHEGQRLRIGKPPLGEDAGPGARLTGDAARFKIQGALGIGASVRVPLWGSGIWVTLKAPSDGALLNLDRIISEEKIMLGRQTKGLIYSNTSVYMNNHLFNFILEHIYETTLKEWTVDSLRGLIRATDLPTLAWGMACAIYPDGYPFDQPCINHPEKCKHITHEILMISKLHWVDSTALTKEQKIHMSRRTARYSVEQIQQYQNQGRISDGKEVTLANGMRVFLRVPTVQEYVDAGYRWMAELSDLVETALGSEVDSSTKNSFIMNHANLSALRQYVHWIKRIVFADESFIETEEALDIAMSTMSSDDATVGKYLEAVKDYIDDVTVSMIALPSYSCPSCGAPQTTEESTHPYLIPLEPNHLFFTLLGRRTARGRTA